MKVVQYSNDLNFSDLMNKSSQSSSLITNYSKMAPPKSSPPLVQHISSFRRQTSKLPASDRLNATRKKYIILKINT